jgi:hypothetical protein
VMLGRGFCCWIRFADSFDGSARVGQRGCIIATFWQ